jgi:hypothetical protein
MTMNFAVSPSRPSLRRSLPPSLLFFFSLFFLLSFCQFTGNLFVTLAKVFYWSTSSERLNPNLYEDGKVTRTLKAIPPCELAHSTLSPLFTSRDLSVSRHRWALEERLEEWRFFIAVVAFSFLFIQYCIVSRRRRRRRFRLEKTSS